MHAGLIEFELGGPASTASTRRGGRAWDVVSTFARSFWRPLVAQIVLVGILWGHRAALLLYLLWVGALLTTYNFSLRVRSIAEHSVVADREDPRGQYPHHPRKPLVEHLLFAPLNVNYHAEHHLADERTPATSCPRCTACFANVATTGMRLYAPGYWFVVRQGDVSAGQHSMTTASVVTSFEKLPARSRIWTS